jgi:hypothetical protein
MNNCTLEVIAEMDYNFDDIFTEKDKHGFFAMIISDMSYMEGYIKGLEKICKEQQGKIEKLESRHI